MEIVKNTVTNASYFGQRATVRVAHLDHVEDGLRVYAVVIGTGSRTVKVSLMTGDGRKGTHVTYETRQCGISQVEETISAMAAEAGHIIYRALEADLVEV